MDISGSDFNCADFRDHFPNLSVLRLYSFRNRISFFFLYEKICDSTIGFAVNRSSVLLQEANTDEKLII